MAEKMEIVTIRGFVSSTLKVGTPYTVEFSSSGMETFIVSSFFQVLAN